VCPILVNHDPHLATLSDIQAAILNLYGCLRVEVEARSVDKQTFGESTPN
jgi:hypothetical protein